MSPEIARHWRLKEQRYRLIGEICENGHKVFPPRDVCPDCGDSAKKKFEFSGKGEIYSATVVYEAGTDHQKYVPYQIAMIKLDEGPMVTAQLTDLPDNSVVIEIGTRVEMVVRKLTEEGDEGMINYGYKFRVPINSSF